MSRNGMTKEVMAMLVAVRPVAVSTTLSGKSSGVSGLGGERRCTYVRCTRQSHTYGYPTDIEAESRRLSKISDFKLGQHEF